MVETIVARKVGAGMVVIPNRQTGPVTVDNVRAASYYGKPRVFVTVRKPNGDVLPEMECHPEFEFEWPGIPEWIEYAAERGGAAMGEPLRLSPEDFRTIDGELTIDGEEPGQWIDAMLMD